jgi:hypothetical protein
LSSFPSEWKLANVTPVFKKDSPGILKNYRPISLISIIGKVMERTLANFHSDGKEDNDSDMLNNLHSGYFNIGAASRKSRGLIQSGPVALLVSKIFGNNECSRTIPPIEHNGNLVFDDIENY